MLQHTSPVQCISIDPFHLDKSNINIVQDNIATFNIHNYDIELTKKFSTDATLIADLRNRGFTTDILFIDGDHRYNAVLHDFHAFHEFVAVGGFIVFDDYHDAEHSPEVKPAVDDIVKHIRANNLPFEIIGSPPNYTRVFPSELSQLNEFILRRV